MFQESNLIFLKGLNHFNTSAFDDALNKKTTAREAVRRFHSSKNQTDSNSESTDFNDVTQIQGLDIKEDLTEITLDLKRQLDTSLGEKDRFIDTQTAEMYLEELKQARNPQRIRQIKDDVKSRQTNVSALINELDTRGVIKIKGNNPLSILRPKTISSLSQREQFINEYLQLSPLEQERRLIEIKDEIQKATQLFNQLIQFLDETNSNTELEQFRLLDNTERQKRIDNYKKVDAKFRQLLLKANLSPKLEKEQIRMFKEQGLEGRTHFLRVLEQNLQQSEKNKEFSQANQKRQSKYPNFNILSESEKEEVLTEIRQEIKQEFLEQFRNHRYFHLVGTPDIQVMEETFQGRFEIQIGEACLKWLDKTMNGFKELQQEEKKYPPEILNHFNWQNVSYFDKKKLLKKGGKVETYAESREHIQLDSSYKERITKYLNTQPIGLINQEGFKSYMEWFQNLPLAKKRLIVQKGTSQKKLDFLEQTKETRKKQNAKFLKLPENIRKEFYDEYMDAGFEERAKILKQIKQRTAQLNNEFQEKLDETIETKLLSPKSRARYWKMFTKHFNLEQREDYLNDCNLDRKERKELLNEFETEVLILVPTELQDKTAKQFYNLDLRRRRKLIKVLKSKYKPKTKKEKELLEARKKMKKAEQKLENTSTISKESIVREHFLKRAKELEVNKDFDGALRFYQEALDLEDELPEAERKKIAKKIETLEKQKENHEKLETTQFDELIKAEVENIISSDEALRTEQRILSLIEEAYKLQATNERYYDRAPDVQTRMHRSLDDGYTKEANEAFQEHTNGEHSFFTDQWGDVEIGQELTFDINEFDTLNELPFWMDYFSEVQDLPKEARADARFTAIDGKTGQTINADRFQKELLNPLKTTFISDRIAPELFTRLEVTNDQELQSAILHRLQGLKLTDRLPKTNKDNISSA
ncbi:MAG: hypothetical protein ACMXYK_04240 [Candidatus Woesearchaeota archaeon]